MPDDGIVFALITTSSRGSNYGKLASSVLDKLGIGYTVRPDSDAVTINVNELESVIDLMDRSGNDLIIRRACDGQLWLEIYDDLRE